MAVPFAGGGVTGGVPPRDKLLGAEVFGTLHAGATFPALGFEGRLSVGSGQGGYRYDLTTGRLDGVYRFLPEARVDPFVLFGFGFREIVAANPYWKHEAYVLAGTDPLAVVFGEAGVGVSVGIVGPLHVRADVRGWVGDGDIAGWQAPFGAFEGTLELELQAGGRPDRDGDGLRNRDDSCPDDAEDFDKLADRDGCPEDDVDRDGFGDAVDHCPTRRETVNRYEDEDGCPDALPAATAALPPALVPFSGSIDGIEFALDSAEILPSSEPVLSSAVSVLNAYPGVRLVVRGHTDATADDVYNLALSKARAEAVVAWLTAHGVDAARLRAEGVGEAEPLETNDTEEGRRRNRRVEFVIVTG